jgi:dienelactone hydrolase
MSVTNSVREQSIPFGRKWLGADLLLPETSPSSLVVAAHDPHRGRDSPEARRLAHWLVAAGAGVLIPELRLDDEARALHGGAEAYLWALRLKAVVRWVERRQDLSELPLGLAGAGIGAAAALRVAADRHSRVRAVTCRSPRLEHAGRWLGRVEAPTLLVVGDADRHVLAQSRRAVDRLRSERSLLVLPGVTHLFDEPGALDAWCRAACAWFDRHLGAASPP